MRGACTQVEVHASVETPTTPRRRCRSSDSRVRVRVTSVDNFVHGVGPDEARLVGGARRWMGRRGIDIVGGDGAPLAASHARAPYDGAYWMRSRRAGASASMTARRPAMPSSAARMN